MNIQTHWITLRVLGLLLACLCVVVWKVPGSLWSPHAFAITPVAPPWFDSQAGPINLPIEANDQMGPAEFKDIAIDVGLSWATIPESSKSSWLDWLTSCSKSWEGSGTLDLFSSVARQRLTQWERTQIDNTLKAIQASPPEPPLRYAFDRIVGFGDYQRNENLKRLFWVGAPALLIFLVASHHIRISRNQARIFNRLGFGPNPPLKSDPTCTIRPPLS